jgi:uncharacterized protein (UPF0332 family)
MNNKDASVQLKLLKSKSLLAEVDVLVEHKFYITAINRLYYSCFHATKALLLTRDFIPKTHSGVVAMLHQHFVQPGLFDLHHASFFSRLMHERIEDDYSDFMVLSEAEVNEFVSPAKDYVAYAEQLIERLLSK